MDENGTHIMTKMASEQNFFIDERLPGLNEIIAFSNVDRHAWNKKKKEVEESIGWCIKKNKISPSETAVDLHFKWIEGNRKRDPDNIVAAKKFILDALVDCGVLPNDGWRHVKSFIDEWEVADKEEPTGVLVTIMEVIDL